MWDHLMDLSVACDYDGWLCCDVKVSDGQPCNFPFFSGSSEWDDGAKRHKDTIRELLQAFDKHVSKEHPELLIALNVKE